MMRKKVSRSAIYIILILTSIFAFFPIYWTINTAMKAPSEAISYPPTFIPKHVTFNNFLEVITAYKFHRNIFSTIFVSLGTIFLSLTVAIYGAYSLSRSKMRGKQMIMISILATSMIPGISILLPLYSLSVKLKIYDSLFGLVLVYSAWLVPSEIWFLKTTFDVIPMEIEESAIIDGCSRLGAFHKVILPNSLIGIASVAIFAFVRVWNDFLIAQTLVISEENKLVSVGLYGFLSQFGIQWSYLMAATVLSALPVILLFVFLQRFYVKGFTAGAVKG